MTDVPNASENPGIGEVLAVNGTTTITCDTNFVPITPSTVTCENIDGVGTLTSPPTCEGESLFSSFEIAYHAGVSNNLCFLIHCMIPLHCTIAQLTHFVLFCFFVVILFEILVLFGKTRTPPILLMLEVFHSLATLSFESEI